MFKRFILLLSFIVVLLNFTNCGSGGGGTSDGNKAPVVNAGSDKSAKVNQSITIVGSATDSDGKIVSYEWKKGDMVLATTPTFNYLPTVVGTDKLTLVVIDDDGAVASDSMVVTVTENSTSTLSKGLIAHYEFEGNAKDSSGNGNDGVEHGGITYANGVIGKAGSFDGVDDYINIGDLTNSYTNSFSVWFKTNTDKYAQSIMGDYIACKYDTGFDFGLYGTPAQNTPRIFFHASYKSTNLEPNINLIDNQWHHVVGEISNGERKLYLDGKLIQIEKENTLYKPSLEDFLIGREKLYHSTCGNGTNSWFHGLIDDIRIYNRALNESEIQELYNLKQ